MGIACEVEVTRSRDGARLEAICAAIPAAALALAALQLLRGPTWVLEGPEWLRFTAALACLLGASMLGWLAARAGFSGQEAGGAHTAMSIDDEGAPSLRRLPDPRWQPMVLRSSCELPGLILLVMAPYPASPPSGPSRRSGRMQTLLLGRSGVNDESWRRLKVWLRWMERGRHAMPAPRPDRT
jgi:hypothetical protein